MRGSSAATTFAFVNYEGPKLPRDPKVRVQIHRHAMRDVAATRKRRGHAPRNVGQYPIDELPSPVDKTSDNISRFSDWSQTTTSSSSEDGAARPKKSPASSTHALQSPTAALIPTIPLDFSTLFTLAPLTGLRLGFATLALSPAHSEALAHPNMGTKKLLTFIPSRYGHVPSLSHATDCVVAKLQQVIEPPTRRKAAAESAVLLCYNKALRALQADLDDKDRSLMPETLCATELLCIFELLGGSPRTHSWVHHAGGAARLIEVRGAHRFNTEFEMALFTAHLGPTVTEAFLNNKACPLTEESWQRVMRSAIAGDDSFAGKHDLVFNMWSHLVGGPGVFKDVTDLICLPATRPAPQNAIDRVIRRLRDDRQKLVDWLEAAQQHAGLVVSTGEVWLNEFLFPQVQSVQATELGDGALHYPQQVTLLALRGTYILCRLIKARLLYALAPARHCDLEVECQNLAQRVVRLREDLALDKSRGLVGSFFMSQSAWVAEGILKTRASWSESWSGDGTIARWRFEAWCRAIGRKFPITE